MGQNKMIDSLNVQRGVLFEKELNWKQVIEKAKRDNKYIFADFYATWCAPCKEMEKNVYALDDVGKFSNEHFVSVKIQLDKSSADNEATKSWYNDADSLGKIYHITSLPTFIFISPDGKLVDKEVGYKSEGEFLDLMKNIIAKWRQYNILVDLYKQHKIDYLEIGDIALNIKRIGDSNLADSIAEDYKVNFLDKLTDDSSLLTKRNMHFITGFPSLIQPGDRFFLFFYRHGEEAERMAATRRGYAQDLVKFLISKEEINNKLYKDGKIVIYKPNWKHIYRNIKVKYSKEYADQLTFTAQVNFYLTTQKWNEFTKVFDEQLTKHPPRIGSKFLNGFLDDIWELNVQAWNLFLYCNNEKSLRKALRWSELSLELCEDKNEKVQFLDTKANLLYKLGLVKDAISIEEDALKLSPNFEDYKSNLVKMKSGIPTWPPN